MNALAIPCTTRVNSVATRVVASIATPDQNPKAQGTLERWRISINNMPGRTRPPNTTIRKMLRFPKRVVFLHVMFLAHMPEVGDLGDPAVLAVFGVVELAMSCSFAAAGEDAGLVPDL
jgi:hypothetical protein